MSSSAAPSTIAERNCSRSAEVVVELLHLARRDLVRSARAVALVVRVGVRRADAVEQPSARRQRPAASPGRARAGGADGRRVAWISPRPSLRRLPLLQKSSASSSGCGGRSGPPRRARSRRTSRSRLPRSAAAAPERRPRVSSSVALAEQQPAPTQLIATASAGCAACPRRSAAGAHAPSISRSKLARISWACQPVRDVAGEGHRLRRLVDGEDRAHDGARCVARPRGSASGKSSAVAGSPAARARRGSPCRGRARAGRRARRGRCPRRG